MINEINAGLYAFDAAWLRRRIGSVAPSPTTGELYLTELVRLAREDGRIVSAVGFEDDGRFDGINDRSQLAAAEWSLRVRLNEAPHAGRRDDARPVDGLPRLGRRPRPGRDPGAERRSCAARPSVGRGASSAPAASSSTRRSAGLRGSGPASSSRRPSRTGRPSARSATSGPGSTVGAGAEVGNFAELKNTRLGAGRRSSTTSATSATPRSASGVNIGAGTITANYDGTRKHPTTIGDGAFIGVDTMLVAPGRDRRGREDGRRRRRDPRRPRGQARRSASRPGSAIRRARAAETRRRRSRPA